MKLSVKSDGVSFNQSLKAIKLCRSLIEQKDYDRSNQLIAYLDQPDILKADVRKELIGLTQNPS